MKLSIKLFAIFLIVITAASCRTVERVIIYKPVISSPPISEDPGRPIFNGDESDELEIIVKQDLTIKKFEAWAAYVMEIIDQLGEEDEE